jgi:hypothetical protein
MAMVLRWMKGGKKGPGVLYVDEREREGECPAVALVAKLAFRHFGS